MSGAGIHNWLHNRWLGITTELDLGNPLVNMENQRFWRLHGWIDVQWTRFRAAKGLSDTQPGYVAALAAAQKMMMQLGGHPFPDPGHLKPFFVSGDLQASPASFKALRGALRQVAGPPLRTTASFHQAALAPRAPDPAEPLATRMSLPFDTAEVVPGVVGDTWFLVVSGYKPYANMRVTLEPLVYIRTPEWWRVEVWGTLDGIGLPMVAPFTVAIPLQGVTGTEGVEVVGGRHSQKVRVPPESDT